MAQAKLETIDLTDTDKDEKQGTSLECAVCLQTCVHPARLPCSHVFCYLCVKGVANQSKKCPMCRQEIPPDFVEKPNLIEVEESKQSAAAEEEYQWFYEGRNGWWQYDQRTSQELETAYKQGTRKYDLLIAGFLYTADFGSMLQIRRNDPARHRRIKRDLSNVPKKGIAGLRLNQQQEEEPVFREIRGAERPASPASDTTGTGDGSSTPVPPSNTPQTPAGHSSGDATPLTDRTDQRADSLHQVLEQMRSLMLTGHLPFNSDNELEESTHDGSFSDHHNSSSILWLQPNASYSSDEDNH
ncbi:E3 ubiquitin-protein ligase RNF146-like isoform X1 [Microplitis mediator]|uniref:E3 ubiquitin-protein ligase RNF146-like isoform X1 n=1 Tax=Microplitis mediator TaxID=375433 RepID=UPI00255748BD|nr:E3 ubiquitin-protein ligase RNF146-like isoform X1 [Microplitis mediator]